MVLKGLPPEYKTFATIVTQKDEKDHKFSDFKVALRSFEETEKCSPSSDSEFNSKQDSVMKTNQVTGKSDSPSYTCYTCGKEGHRSFECKNKKRGNKWCNHCKSNTHYTNQCRKKDSAKVANSSTLMVQILHSKSV